MPIGTPSTASGGWTSIVNATGTADQTAINTAISNAAGTSARILLTGDFVLTGAVDFSPLAVASASADGYWVLFDATAATFTAGANLTSMFNLAAGAGSQIFSKLDARIGRINGNSGTYTVTQGVYTQRFVDNRVSIGEIISCSGFGFNADQAGVTDYGCFNNTIDILKCNSNAAGGFKASSDALSGHIYGFQGNTVRIGQVHGNLNGVIAGSAANGNAISNRFELGAVEHNTSSGIVERCGGNLWLVNNINSNTTTGIIGSTGMTTYSTFIVPYISDTIDTTITSQHIVFANGFDVYMPKLPTVSGVTGLLYNSAGTLKVS